MQLTVDRFEIELDDVISTVGRQTKVNRCYTTGEFCEGDRPTVADCCLVPQVYNARRFKLDMAAFPHIARIDAACRALAAFDAARPEIQPDAPASA